MSDGDNPIELLESRWTLQILLLLDDDKRRFSDLRFALPGISANVLTVRMRALESSGLVGRRYIPPPAASHVYELTDAAQPLRPILHQLSAWRATFSTPEEDINSELG